MNNLIADFKEKINLINNLETDQKILCINILREMIHEISPFKNEPIDFVKWVSCNDVVANDYNPNSVAPKEMELLRHSIDHDGYTQPVVTWDRGDIREVVDGFHRTTVCKKFENINQRVLGHLPVVTINSVNEDRNDRIAATIRHNRARGKHKIDSMSDIVVELKKRRWKDEKIAKELGMEADEVLRLAQVSGIAEMFVDATYSEAWEAEFLDNIEIIDENEVILGSEINSAEG